MPKVLLVCSLMAIAMAAPQAIEDISYKPFSFEYQVAHDDNTVYGMKQTADGNGQVDGSYHVEIPFWGTYRRIVFVSTPLGGTRMYVDTNEPGVGEDAPADVELTKGQTPPDAYTKQWPRRQ
ncbi:Uncharacterised protein r2_g3182 [Pycnogonum litorale]